MSIYSVDPNLSNAAKIAELNAMILELNGKLAQAQFNKNEIDSIYLWVGAGALPRQYLRNQPVGNTVATYTGWSHLKAQSGYSIWKYSPAAYDYNALNNIYMNNKMLNFMGQANSESATAFDSVFFLNNESGGTYHDYTALASVEGSAGFDLMDSTSDLLYLGLSTTFTGARFEWQTRGSNYGLYLEYWTGSAWAQLVPTSYSVSDGTTNFQSDGHITWTAPGDWAARYINGQNKYWVRISSTSTPVTVAKCNYLIPATSVVGLLSLSSTDIQEENWAWCSYGSAVYVTIRNTGNSSYEGSYYITSASSATNLQNFFVYNQPITGDYQSTSWPL